MYKERGCARSAGQGGERKVKGSKEWRGRGEDERGRGAEVDCELLAHK